MIGDSRGVGGMVLQRVWDEENASDRAIELEDVRGAVVEKARAARDERAADQHEMRFGFHRARIISIGDGGERTKDFRDGTSAEE